MLIAQSCPTLCNPMDPPGSSVYEILQARILECVAILFSKWSSNPKIKAGSHTLQTDSLSSEPPGSESEVAQSCPTLCDPWTVAHQAPPSMGFSRQEYWSGLPFPSPVRATGEALYNKFPTYKRVLFSECVCKSNTVSLGIQLTQAVKLYCTSELVYQWKMKVLVAQLCLTLCNPTDYSPPGSSVHGILQARILEWVAIPFFRGSSRPKDQTWLSCIASGFFTVWATREAQ